MSVSLVVIDGENSRKWRLNLNCFHSCPPSGSFYNYYAHYDYTYISSGIILIVASVILFVGMTINYRMLAREKKEEERREREEPKEELTAMLAPPSPSKSDELAEKKAPEAVALENVARMDEDTV